MGIFGIVYSVGNLTGVNPFLPTEDYSQGFVPLSVMKSEINDDNGAPTLDVQALFTELDQSTTEVINQPGDPIASPIPTYEPVIPTRLIISSIGLDAPIIPSEVEEKKIDNNVYVQWKAPDLFAVGWHSSSALLGEIGNTVLNGHHNVHGKVFENLHKVKPGDQIFIFGGSLLFRYKVVNVMILSEEGEDLYIRMQNSRWILESDDERITMVTCYPSYSNTHRLIVVAAPDGPPVDTDTNQD